MSLVIASLNSGSNGNCYYVGNSEEAVLIDVGITCREVEKRMKRIGLQIENVKAIFISHEHTDHISGVAVLAKKYNLPVYITPVTLAFSNLKIAKELLRNFVAEKNIVIGNLNIIPFRKFHDGKDPHSFIVCGNGVNIGVFTDIGIACEKVIAYFKQCNAVFLEANYDEEMLMRSSYPVHIKKRIKSNEGHLSNVQALQLFLEHKPVFMSHLILAHLSQNNNRAEIVEKLFFPYKHLAEITVASRYKESAVFNIISNTFQTETTAPVNRQQKATQLSFFA